MRIIISVITFLLLSVCANDTSASDRQEVPDNLFNVSLESGLVDRVGAMLPEYSPIDPYFLENSNEATFTLTDDAEVFTTFIHEGAGYKNSFGYFTLSSDNQIIEQKEIIGNASQIGSGGLLKPGDTTSIGTFEKDTTLGFYVWANGWNKNPGTGNKYYTHQDFNQDGIKHVVTSYDATSKKVVIGFEDLWGGGDNDYNDLIFTIFSNPPDIIENSSQNLPNITGQQVLGSAEGMVTMSVAKFVKLKYLTDVTMYPINLEQIEDVVFKGVGEFLVESNCGILISVATTPLVNNGQALQTTHTTDNLPHTLITPENKIHYQVHTVEIYSQVSSITQVESGQWQGSVTVTVSAY
jgi:hypothetical protein